MHVKKKVGVIAGSLEHVSAFSHIEALADRYDLTIFCKYDENMTKIFPSNLVFKLFENVPDMPGYLRGLEDELYTMDLIVCMDIGTLASFQGVRAAKKNKIPILFFVEKKDVDSEALQHNLSSIRSELEKTPHLIFAAHSSILDWLVENGFDANKIVLLGQKVSSKRFKPDAGLRQKFRKYASLSEDDIIILSMERFESKAAIEEYISLLRFLRLHGNNLFRRIKFLFVGDGPFSDSLKYMISEHGLSQHVRFLHQDPRPIMRDIYSSTDFMLCLTERSPAELRPVIEANCCGVTPIFVPVAFEAMWPKDAGAIFVGGKTQALGRLLLEECSKYDWQASAQISQLLAGKAFDVKPIVETVFDAVEGLFALNEGKSRKPISAEILLEAKQLSNSGKEQEALGFIDQKLKEISVGDIKMRASLLAIKGQTLIRCHRIEDARVVLEQSVELQNHSEEVYIALAKIALKTFSYEEALFYYRKSLAAYPNCYEALFGMGMVFKNLNMYAEAIYWLEKSILSKPDSKQAILAFSQACLNYDHTRTAIEHVLKIRETIDHSAALTLALGQLYMKDGKVQEGKLLLTQALEDEKKIV
jgi:glycosyltransferase involved in cell wall biosynthesis